MITLKSKMKISKLFLLPNLTLLSLSRSSFSLANTCNHNHHVSNKWKSIPDVNNELYHIDIKLHKFLSDSIPEALAHTGTETFDDHLKGTCSDIGNFYVFV